MNLPNINAQAYLLLNGLELIGSRTKYTLDCIFPSTRMLMKIVRRDKITTQEKMTMPESSGLVLRMCMVLVHFWRCDLLLSSVR